MIPDAAAQRIVQQGEAQIAAHAVGIADIAGVVPIISRKFHSLEQAVGGAAAGGAGLFVKVGEQAGKNGGAEEEIPFAVFVEIATQHQVFERFDVQQVGMLGNSAGLGV